jgi:hypothetical protein
MRKTTKKGTKQTKGAKAESNGRAARKKLDLKPGQQLTRKFKDKEHVVKVTKIGFEYDGETFGSLTAIAKKITGAASINGRSFFKAR